MEEKQITEQESLQLITSMINKARNSYHDTGSAAILWGVVIAFCSLVQLAEIVFKFELPFDIYWLTFAAIIPQIVFAVREKRTRTMRSHNDVVMDYLWMSFGLCILLLIHADVGLFHSVDQIKTDYFNVTGKTHPLMLSDFVLSYFLMLYGFPTFVTGAIMNFRPMIRGGIVCWVCSVICVYTPIETDLSLTALSAICAWLIPGLLLRKKYLRIKMAKPELDV